MTIHNGNYRYHQIIVLNNNNRRASMMPSLGYILMHTYSLSVKKNIIEDNGTYA